MALVEADNAVSLDFAESSGEIIAQHYAFLVGEDEFDAAFGRIRDRGLTYWADPGKSGPGRSTTTTAAAACTSTTPTVTGWRSSPARTAAAARSLTGDLGSSVFVGDQGSLDGGADLPVEPDN